LTCLSTPQGSTADADALIEETTKAHREFQESNGSVAEDLRKVIEDYKQAKTTEGTQRVRPVQGRSESKQDLIDLL
jgi:vacuolar-type H+-ATPase subunit D/Vma8